MKQPISISEDEYQSGRKVVAFDDDAYLMIGKDRKGNIRVQSIQASAQVRGTEMLQWLKNQFDAPILADEVVPPAAGFWKKMKSEGLIDAWSPHEFMDKFVDFDVEQQDEAFVEFHSMPPDMQDILMSFFGEFGQDVPARLATTALPLSLFPDVALADGVNDERGIEYAREMIGEDTPPVIVHGEHWLDGRHRVWAHKQSGAPAIQAIDIGRYLPVDAIQVIEPIAKLIRSDLDCLDNHRPWEDESLAANGVAVKENFAHWFGKSHVVHADNTPMVVYHGTAYEFDAFDGGRGGYYFTSDLRAAKAYAEHAEGDSDPRIVAAYLSMQNPLVLDRAWYDENVLVDGEPEWEVVDNTIYEAEEAGHDGMILKGFPDFDGMVLDPGSKVGRRLVREYDQYIAFRPHQIKSAMENSGLFLKDSPCLFDAKAAEELALAMRARNSIEEPKLRCTP